MSVEGVDYAWDRPSPAGLAAVGKVFACRYGGPGSSGKHVDLAEAHALAAAGLSIVANAEGAADGLLGGYAVGRAWAVSADAHFRGAAMPDDRPIYLSCDFDVTAGQWPAVAEALRGAAAVIGAARVGIYGGHDAVVWARRDGVARWFWQTYAWSEGRWAPGNHIEQYRNGVSLVGGTVDLDRAHPVDFGQWVPAGTPQPPPGGEDDDMTAADVWDARFTGTNDDGQPYDFSAREMVAGANQAAWATLEEVRAMSERWLATPIAGDAGNPARTVEQWGGDIHGAVHGRVQQIEAALAELAAKVDTLATTPLIDAVAVAAAIAAHPDIAATMAAQVAARLAGIQGEITLSGSLAAGIVPPIL